MIKRLNNKGYMLIEIILAFVIAMGITYFMFELIIKIKNKNDDLLVKTLVATDQAIVYNTVMKDLSNGNSFSCNKIEIENNKFKYDGEFVSEISEYAIVSNVECSVDGNDVTITIPIAVKQLNDNFNINIKYKLDDDVVTPSVPITPSARCPSGYSYGTYYASKVGCWRSFPESSGGGCGGNEVDLGCLTSSEDECACMLKGYYNY